jgi:hypothetical protein
MTGPSPGAQHQPTYLELKRLEAQKWLGTYEIAGLPTENVEDLRRHETELRQNAGGDGNGSEMSIGAGLEAPWTVRRAAARYEYTRPDDFGGGGRYHGTTPPMTWQPGYPPPPRPGYPLPKTQGSLQLRRFLRQEG